ncbi:hypothetical protein LTR53_001073 [Teratosphaeriaceae sp. CCFEE 6253]|nr:hypothetical protein LTR53_001073 [Teratosphaeriaceae sp. CCFEE 6253]
MFELRALRSTAFWAITGLAIITQVIVFAIVLRLTTTSPRRGEGHALGIAASIFDLLSLALLLCSVGTRRLPDQGSVLSILYGSATATSVVAASLSFGLLGLRLRHRDGNGRTELASAGLALLIILLLLQTAFYSYLLWPIERRGQQEVTDIPTIEHSSPTSSGKRSISVRLAHLKPVAPSYPRSASEPYSPTLSRFSASPTRSSFRDSVQQTLKPMTSKSRLLRNSFLSSDAHSLRSGKPVSFDTIRSHDEFHAWDTSAVEDVPDTPAIPRAYKLETIPGSRPVSPAKALDGPFSTARTPADTPLPDSPRPSDETGSFLGGEHMPPLRRPSTHQSHIHPLFRSESPIPPPLPSPGTVVTASPLAGQIVSPEHAMGWTLHSTQTWRPGSTTPVSSTGSRSGSVRSLRLQPTSPTKPLPSSPLHGSGDVFGS